MADPIDTAAAAFLTDMGNAPAPKRSGNASEGASDGPTEAMFGDHDGFENEEDSSEEDLREGKDDEGDEELPSGDEDEGDGPDDEDDEDEGDDEDDEGAEDDEGEQSGSLNLDQKIVVKVDGEDVETTLGEAVSGYIRSETFHQRLNLLNEAKNEIVREQGETAAARQKYIEGLEALQQQLVEITPREPTQAEWDALYADDPAKARQQEQAWRTFKQQKADIVAATERAKAEQAEQHRKTVTNWINAEHAKIMRAVPQWNDEGARRKELESMKRTANAVGYSDEEVRNLYDHRAILVLRKAAAYDRLMAKKPKSVKTVVTEPKASGSGRPSGQTDRKGVGRSMDALRKTGSVGAATAVFGELLKLDDRKSNRRRG